MVKAQLVTLVLRQQDRLPVRIAAVSHGRAKYFPLGKFFNSNKKVSRNWSDRT